MNLDTKAYLERLISFIKLERKAQTDKYQNINLSDFKKLKQDGILIHPLKITNKHYGFADYPTFQFNIIHPIESSNFKSGSNIELILEDNEPVKGNLIHFDGRTGEIRLKAPDFPETLEARGTAIKLSLDEKTFRLMEESVDFLLQNEVSIGTKFLDTLFNTSKPAVKPLNQFVATIPHLNDSQNEAVAKIVNNQHVLIIHGPPGTGKTTTLIAAIQLVVKSGAKILLTAPSNAAVDHIAEKLVQKDIRVVRMGNNTKVNEKLLPYTIDGALEESNVKKRIKELHIQSNQFRKMASQYKRNFGKDDRDQRKLLLNEVKNIRTEIRNIQNYELSKLIENAQVIVGTPVGLTDSSLKEINFHTLIIDEAGQCLDAMAMILINKSERIVLAGDHLQLPPTVLSQELINKKMNGSILETFIDLNVSSHFLDTQYRMREAIAHYSNAFFYENKLKTPANLKNNGEHVFFIDTAGTGFEETQNEQTGSLENLGELEIIEKIIEHLKLDLSKTSIISPYSAQVLAINKSEKGVKGITIDSFQGQENENIIISLVRSNSEQNIGFLKEHRRMNVAFTRAKEKLIIIGDSSTIGIDSFFNGFLEYCENINGYKSAFEFI